MPCVRMDTADANPATTVMGTNVRKASSLDIILFFFSVIYFLADFMFTKCCYCKKVFVDLTVSGSREFLFVYDSLDTGKYQELFVMRPSCFNSR